MSKVDIKPGDYLIIFRRLHKVVSIKEEEELIFTQFYSSNNPTCISFEDYINQGKRVEELRSKYL